MWHYLGQLPAKQRAVLVLRYYEGLSEAEIAETLGLGRGTVKSHARAGWPRCAAGSPTSRTRWGYAYEPRADRGATDPYPHRPSRYYHPRPGFLGARRHQRGPRHPYPPAPGGTGRRVGGVLALVIGFATVPGSRRAQPPANPTPARSGPGRRPRRHPDAGRGTGRVGGPECACRQRDPARRRARVQPEPARWYQAMGATRVPSGWLVQAITNDKRAVFFVANGGRPVPSVPTPRASPSPPTGEP